jgi:hypothetical protein
VRTISTIPRMIAALALVSSLGFAAAQPCNRNGARQASVCCSGHDSPSCKCNSQAGACCGGSQCGCGRPAPKQENQAALPTPNKDLVQWIALGPTVFVFGDVIEPPSSCFRSQAYLTGLATNLIAQGTRLNI